MPFILNCGPKNPTIVEEGFHIHLNVLKKFFYVFYEVGDCGKGLFVSLLVQNIDYQMVFFKMAVVHNVGPFLHGQ
jgi:hypothetical protein